MSENGSHRTIQRPAALPGVEIHRGQHSGGSCGGFLTQYSIGIIQGRLRYRYGGESRERAGKYVLLRQANEFPPVEICGALTFEHWYIAPEVMRQAAEECGRSGTPRFAQEVTEDPRTYQLLRRATTVLECETGALEHQETLTHLLDAILGQYAEHRHIMADVIVHRAVRRMRDLIRDCCAEELSLDVLAKHAGLNKFYALRAFKRAMGVPPHAYQRHVRVARARELLRAGRPSTEIAYELGFCDQSHFIRCFRQVALVTPRQYQLGS